MPRSKKKSSSRGSHRTSLENSNSKNNTSKEAMIVATFPGNEFGLDKEFRFDVPAKIMSKGMRHLHPNWHERLCIYVSSQISSWLSEDHNHQGEAMASVATAKEIDVQAIVTGMEIWCGSEGEKRRFCLDDASELKVLFGLGVDFMKFLKRRRDGPHFLISFHRAHEQNKRPTIEKQEEDPFPLEEMRERQDDAKFQAMVMHRLKGVDSKSLIGKDEKLAEGIVLAIVIAMKRHPDDMDLQRQACEAICNLSVSRNCLGFILRHVCFKAVMTHMKTTFLDDAEFQAMILTCLDYVLYDDTAPDLLVKSGTVEAVLKVLAIHDKDSQIQEHGINVLYEFCAFCYDDLLLELVIFATLVSMRTFLDDEFHQVRCVRLLRNVSWYHGERMAPVFKAKDGPCWVLFAMEKYAGNQDLQNDGIQGLLCFLGRPDVESPVFHAILRAMVMHPDCKDICCTGMHQNFFDAQRGQYFVR